MKPQRITLLTLPLSPNSVYAHMGRRRFMTTRGKENKEQMAWEARRQHRGVPIAGPVSLKIALWWPTRANRDLDNIKLLLDALTGILWLDDSQIQKMEIEKGYDKENPRVEIEYREI